MKINDFTQYKRRLHTIDMKKMIVFCLVLLVLSTGFFVALHILFAPKSASPWWMWLAAVVATFFCLFVHELLHALAFIVIGGSKSTDIKFGGNFNQGFLYCTSTKPLRKGQYITTILFPFALTLTAGALLSLLQGHLAWPIAAGILLSGCAGDIMMAVNASKLAKGALVLDHPAAPAYYELVHQSALPEGFAEATPEQELALAKQMDEFKTANTKTNKILAWTLLVCFLVFAVAAAVILIKSLN